MFKFSKNVIYQEMSQANPLLWRILDKKGDVFTDQSGEIRCKDFFNDIVAWKHGGHKFSIYKFNNEITFNRGGLWFLLTNVYDTDQFVTNMLILNEKLTEQLKCRMKIVPVPEGVLIQIPTPLWKSTYRISTITSLIRLCNYKKTFEKWEDFFGVDSPVHTTETNWNNKTRVFVQKNGFKLNSKYSKYWYFSTFGYTSAGDKPISPKIVHNNGMCDWVKAIEQHEAPKTDNQQPTFQW